ncbi:MAG: hypothetical protein MI922_10390, partial [Bacteroidales bacterium]|nr:hypothetical protein [Bacteroidales bacterium]
MNKTVKYLYAVVSGVLLALPWYEWGTGWFLFIGFIPLLMLESNLAAEKKKPNFTVLKYGAITFLTWNFLATWWIKNASFAGMLAAVFVTSFLMLLAFFLF